MPIWVSILLCVAGLCWIVEELTRQAEASGVAVIDPRRSRLQTREEWLHPEWEDTLADVLARAGLFSARDRQAIDALGEEVRALPFVAEIGEPVVVWPDGLVLPIALRSPVACIVDEDSSALLPVADDGTVLPGSSSVPHPAYGGWLPVLGPGPLAVAPGDRLSDPAHLEALAVAISLWNELDGSSRRRLGRVMIDASRERAPDGLPGGIVIDMEMQRRIVFGRAPRAPFPGELPHELKWAHVARALAALESGAAWDTYDVRWDEPVAMRRSDPASVAALRVVSLASVLPAGGSRR